MKRKLYPLVIAAVVLYLCTGCQRAEKNPPSTAAPPSLETTASESLTAQTEAPLSQPQMNEVDLSSYFDGLKGSAVFYSPSEDRYDVYQMDEAKKRYSPCSTFKIISALAALEYGIVTEQDSSRKWSGEVFWKNDWNRDISLRDAFQTSCIWYFRSLIDEMGPERMQDFLDGLQYGNGDISDWKGEQNANNQNRSLTGFWVESSLKISTMEQVGILARIFQDDSVYQDQNIRLLKEIMKVEQEVTSAPVYGKTGYGKLGNVSLDSWFVGMFETDDGLCYFGLHLAETDRPGVDSSLAKQMALQIIEDRYVHDGSEN